MATFREIHICDDWCTVNPCGVGRPPTPWCERFESHILYVGDCWIWKSVANKLDCERNRLNFSLRQSDLHNRVGVVQMDACRWIYTRTIGEIPEGLQLDHWYCENWRCVHPEHLEPVTNLENNERYSFKRKEWTIRDELGRFAGRRLP